MLPPRREIPYLARAWDDAAGAISCYQDALWSPDQSPRYWAEISRGASTTALLQDDPRRMAIAALNRLMVADVAEHLRSDGWTEVPPWVEHLVATAVSIEPTGLQRIGLVPLVQRIAEYRRTAGVDFLSSDTGLLGEMPNDPSLRALHHVLATEVQQLSNTRSHGRAI